MSVYIKGMEMPKEGDLIVIRPDGKAYYVSAKPQNAYEGDAVPVPSHGRLIDADVIMTKLNETSRRVFGNDGVPECSALSIVADYIEAAPTIIPANEE